MSARTGSSERLRGPKPLPLVRVGGSERPAHVLLRFLRSRVALTDGSRLSARADFARDKGVCASCGTDTVAAFLALKRSRGPGRVRMLQQWGLKTINRRTLWDADHIVPVAEGGGACDLSNIRTLCLLCHREVTRQLRERLAER